MANERPPSENSRTEYLARIHRVMDYVEAHLDAELTLAELARVACFSPFHFHRIFTACTGEPLYQFILRLRLERAATQLRQDRRKSVTAIALDCGFGSSAAFARAFRAAFGASATEWRAESRKNCEAHRKISQDPDGWAGYSPSQGASDKSARRMPMSKITEMLRNTAPKEAESVRIENLPSTRVAYVRHVGPYAGDEQLFNRLFGRLCQWLGPRGLMGPGTRLLTIYHDSPDITDEDKLRISVCATVPATTQPEGEIGVMTLDGGTYAVAKFELDASEYGGAWKWLMGMWLPESGYQPDDRHCFELYLNDPSQHPQRKHQVEIWEPVKPL
jgi:AraC family transcriptional regulator